MQSLLLVTLALIGLTGCQSEPPPKPKQTPPGKTLKHPNRVFQLDDLERAELKFAGKTIKVWLMNDPPKRQEGMMFLEKKDVKDDEGMLFVFPDVSPRSFWMQNTLIALDIAYMTPAGNVVSVRQGKPLDEAPLPSGKPAKYVLEMKEGAFKRLGIKPGVTIQIPANLKAE